MTAPELRSLDMLRRSAVLDLRAGVRAERAGDCDRAVFAFVRAERTAALLGVHGRELQRAACRLTQRAASRSAVRAQQEQERERRAEYDAWTRSGLQYGIW